MIIRYPSRLRSWLVGGGLPLAAVATTIAQYLPAGIPRLPASSFTAGGVTTADAPSPKAPQSIAVGAGNRDIVSGPFGGPEPATFRGRRELLNDRELVSALIASYQRQIAQLEASLPGADAGGSELEPLRRKLLKLQARLRSLSAMQLDPGESLKTPAAEAPPRSSSVPSDAGSVPNPPGAVEVSPASDNPNEYSPSTDKADCEVCKRRLQRIGAAILAYRKDHQAIPHWLSDLVPQYLNGPADSICPVTEKTGRLSAFGPLDPKIRCSYLYEFAPAPMTSIVRSAFPGPLMTNLRWKQQQMACVGFAVPIVRCLLHEPALNLSYGGEIYESGLSWEDSFTDLAKRADFAPHE